MKEKNTKTKYKVEKNIIEQNVDSMIEERKMQYDMLDAMKQSFANKILKNGLKNEPVIETKKSIWTRLKELIHKKQ